MARIVIKKDRGPKQVEKGAWVCMCGLSANQPFCDGSHKKTLDETDDTYFYTEQGRLTVEEIRAKEAVCACGHNGQCVNCKHK